MLQWQCIIAHVMTEINQCTWLTTTDLMNTMKCSIKNLQSRIRLCPTISKLIQPAATSHCYNLKLFPLLPYWEGSLHHVIGVMDLI